MRTFLYNSGKAYSYDDLFQSINSCDTIYPIFRTDDLYNYFVNLLKGIATNSHLTLIDSDTNIHEIPDLNENDINTPHKIESCVMSSLTELISKVSTSSSKITLYTSGTTGQPKKVTHQIKNLIRAVRTGDKYKDHIWGFAYNPTHMAGLQVFFQALMNINPLINVFCKSREEVYSNIQEHQITHISATPTFYRLLLPYEKPYNSVVRVTLGGEKSDERLYESLQLIFPNCKITNVYASTEAGTLFASKGDVFQMPLLLKDKIIVKDEELLIHRSLLGDSENFVFTDDYYHTGDLIEWVDEIKGLFRFKSRKNELINVGGYKVNPTEIEESILGINGISQVYVYGKPNSILGNVLCADIQLNKGAKLTEIEIKKHLSSYLQYFKIPRRIKFVDEIELTKTGKKKRK